MFQNLSFNGDALVELEREFDGVALFSVDAQQSFLQKADSLAAISDSEESDEQEPNATIMPEPQETKKAQETRATNAISLLCYLRYKFLMKSLKNPLYFDLSNLRQSDTRYYQLTFTGESIQKCQEFTEAKNRENDLTLKEKDIYSFSAHLNPPTKLNPSIEGFLDSLGIQYNPHQASTLNIKLTEKLKAIKIGKYTICDEEWGHFNAKIPINKMAPRVIDCVIEVINENYKKTTLKLEERQSWIDAFTQQMGDKLKRFNRLRKRAEGRETFDVLCILHASLSAYMQTPITQGDGEEYILDIHPMPNILDTISFSASIAKELEICKGDATSINQLVTTKVMQKVDHFDAPVILPVCTPILPGKSCSEHAFYLVLKKVSDAQYKISIVNCGYASEHDGVVDFPRNLNTQQTVDYLCDAFAVEFFQLIDNGQDDEDQLVSDYLKDNIYDEKTYGELVVSNSTVNEQFYGNCTLHNYNFAIKHCFELDTLNFSKFRQMHLVGFDRFIETNKRLLVQNVNAATPFAATQTTTTSKLNTTAITTTATEKSDKERALRKAAMDGNEINLRSLLAQNVDVNCKGDQSQKTALHLAAGNNHLGCVQILLAAGAIQTTDSSGSLPTNYANRRIRQALQGNTISSANTTQHHGVKMH